jgi:hypothetical protein
LGNNNVGGLVGEQGGYGRISNSYSIGGITGTSAIGGLIGASYGEINNCYARGGVFGDNTVGGLVGITTQGDIFNCYSASIVAGESDIGGLVGYGNNASYTKCFWDIDVNPDVNGIGSTTDPDVIGESTANMQTEITFTDAGWDFVDVWSICEQTNYPRFLWQIPIGDFLCPDGVNFIDYSFFVSHWLEDDCGSSNDCDGTDLDKLGSVDSNDLGIFVYSWLMGVRLIPPLGRAGNPNPSDRANYVDIDADLSWMAGFGATSHDVYFGTSNPPLFLLNQITTTFEPGTMAYDTRYYWRIDETNSNGTTKGIVWSFTTEGESPPPPPPL